MKNYIKKLTPSAWITGIHLIAVLVGLPLAVHYAYYDIGETKYYFYCGAAAILFPALILELIKRPSAAKFLKSLTKAEWALLVYWIVSALSTLLSKYRFEAFWGNEGRYTGLMLITVYTAVYFVITRCCKPHPIYMYACILGGSIVFALAITDFFNLNLLHFKDGIDPNDADKFISTMGNINFYASYGSVVLGVVAALYATWSKAKGSIVYFFLVTLSFVGLIVGNSDNAYLAFGVVMAFLPLYLFKDRRGLRRYCMLVSALLLSFMLVRLCDIYLPDLILPPDGFRTLIAKWGGFVYLSLAVWGITAVLYITDYKMGRQNAALTKYVRIAWGIFLAIGASAVIAVLVDANLLGNGERYGGLRNYVVFNDDWGTLRGYAWRKGIENYKQFSPIHKVFGCGPDTYGIIFYFKDMVERSMLYDSVHNEYLQFFITVGPIGMAAYMMFLALSLREMFKKPEDPFIMAAAFGTLCYCVQAIVNINQPGSTPIFWTILALGIAHCRNVMKESDHIKEWGNEDLKKEE